MDFTDFIVGVGAGYVITFGCVVGVVVLIGLVVYIHLTRDRE
jgi:hypothetical protein